MECRSDVLDALLTEANSNPDDEEAGGDEISAACIALLSHPLANGILLPDSAQTFFLRLVERAVSSSNAETLRAVYNLLEGACQGLLGILPIATLTAFVEDVFKILRGITNVTEPLHLVCLGILRTVVGFENDPARSVERVGPSLTGPIRHFPKHSLESANAYFTGAKASKTLQLVALQVMWAYKIEDPSQADATQQLLEMAINIVGSIEESSRAEWSKTNAPVLRKITEKIIKNKLSPDVKLLGFVFVGILVGEPSTLRLETLTAGEEALLGGLRLQSCNDSFLNLQRRFFTVYAENASSHCVGSILAHALDLCVADNTTPFSGFCKTTAVLRDIACLQPSNDNFAKTILAVFNSSDVYGVRNRILALANRSERTSKVSSKLCSTPCNFAHSQALDNLSTAIRELVVQTVLLGPTSNLFVSGADASRLLGATRSQPFDQCHCEHSRSISKQSSAILRPQEEPQWSSNTWDTRLGHALHHDLSLRHASVVRLVNEVCEDLQRRCDHVEEPLRHEQEKSQKLVTQCTNLEKQLQSAQDTIASNEEKLKRQTDRHETMVEQLSRSESTAAMLLTQVEEQELSLRRTEKAAENDIQKLLREHDDAKLLYQGELATMNEDLEHLQGQVKVNNETLEATITKNNALEAQLDRAQTELASSIDKLRAKEQELTMTIGEKDRLSAELVDLRSVESSLNAKLEDLEEQATRYVASMSELETQLHKEREASKTSLKTAEAAHASALEHWNAADQKAKQQHSTALDKLEREIEQERVSHETTKDELCAARSEVHQSTAAIEQLERKLEESNMALAEAQDMRKRLMQAMGLSAEALSNPTSGQRRLRPITTNKAANLTRISTKPDPQIKEQKSFESGASSSAGPTPKRAKPRTSFVVPKIQASKHVKGYPPSAKRMSAALRIRQPLLDTPGRGNVQMISPLKSDSKAKARQPTSTGPEQYDLNTDDLDLDTSELFTGTPFVPTINDNNDQHNGMCNDENYDLHDETTAEL